MSGSLQEKVYGNHRMSANTLKKIGHYNGAVKKMGHYNGAVKKMGHYNGAVKKMGHYNGIGASKNNIGAEIYPYY